MIEVAHLTKRYSSLPAVQDLSFSAIPGQILGSSANGAGRRPPCASSPASCRRPKSTVRIGVRRVRQSAEVRSASGYLPENPPLQRHAGHPVPSFAAKLRGMARADVDGDRPVLERAA
jgi:ABC-type uncharacterized transport system ATPase subunit